MPSRNNAVRLASSPTAFVMQEKILKIIKGLNTFSLDDILMMCDADEDEVENLLEDFVSEKIIQKISDYEYRYLGKAKSKEAYLKLIEPDKEKSSNIFSEMTFKTAAEYFLEHHAKKNCTPSTYKTYKTLINAHLIQFFGRKKLTKISNNNIEKFIEIKKEQKLKNKRLRNCVTLLGNMFERFKEWNFVEKSPYNGITNIQYSREQKISVLTDIEQKQILDESKKVSHNLYLFILLALNTGLKKAEIIAIKVEDIDLQNNTICINKNLSEGVFVIPRGKASIRKIIAPKDILTKLVENKAQKDFVFYDTSYSAFTLKKALRREFAKVLKALNMPSITMNDLRHTYAYNALQSGMSIEYLHKQLGDYSIQATMDRYRDFISA